MFKPGQKVVYIGKPYWQRPGQLIAVLIKDSIYTVRGTGTGSESCYITLMEFSTDFGFHYLGFRPVDETFGKEVCEQLEKDFVPHLQPA